ncbi:unnamed protein product [Polarella glacialis]|uniref:Reverse transcriptase domain-containing protein n=1 Tax=Polarella glacialis TaxID=89957 RepID=A0A813FAC4_POLGL|nr:unnamed protein product [Polarella glacialis]
MGDADYAVFNSFKTGVTLGVLQPMPRTPAVFEEQVKWKRGFDPFADPSLFASNYKSLGEHLGAVEEQFRLEQEEGMMLEMDWEDFVARFGTNYAISALAVLQEGEKLRVLHDGSNTTMVNHRIRPWDKVRMPGFRELQFLLRMFQAERRIPVSVVGDVSKAHRRVKIDPLEQGYQSCQLRPGKVWVNRVGTFGMVPISYWWSRLSGGLLRAVYGMLGSTRPVEILWYADDLNMMGCGKEERRAMVLVLFFLAITGVPMKQAKFRGGYQYDWIGLTVDMQFYAVGISAARAQWLVRWLTEAVEAPTVRARVVAGALGRLGFAVTALTYEKTFLGPLYLWVSAMLRAGKEVVTLPWAVRLIFAWLAHRLAGAGRLQQVRPLAEHRGELFRSDAKAEGGIATIGGWECMHGTPASGARWFYLEVESSWAPWAFAKASDPGRVIAALELLGTILCVKLFSDRWGECFAGGCTVTGSADNRGNSFVTMKLMSTKWPLTVLLMELSETLRAREAELRLDWVRREFNTEADAITNQEFAAFDPLLRIQVEGAAIPWLVLPAFMEASQRLYDEIVCERAGATGNGPRRRRGATTKLRTMDPWQ